MTTMTIINRVWAWFGEPTASIGAFAVACVGAFTITVGVAAIQPAGVALASCIFGIGAVLLCVALDLAAREARAKEAVRWATTVLEALRNDSHVEITVTTTHVDRRDGGA